MIRPKREMPEPINDTPENVARIVMGAHLPGGKWPGSETGEWPHETEYREAMERYEKDVATSRGAPGDN